MDAFDVFVSYSRHDEPLVVPVVKLLRLGEHGMVFIDLDGIRPGERWREKLEDALRRSRYVLVFWCAHSSASPEVGHEVRAARAAGKELVPVLLDATPLPVDLSDYQWIDLQALAGPGHAHHPPAAAAPPPAVALTETSWPSLPTLPSVATGEPVLTLTAISLNGAPLVPAPKACFGAQGGHIGRADSNQMVLPDPARLVSRVHARVARRGDRFTLVDLGLNPTSVNGRALVRGETAVLHGGEQVLLGGYVIRVEIDHLVSTPEPTDLFTLPPPQALPTLPGPLPETEWAPLSAGGAGAPVLPRAPAAAQPVPIDELLGGGGAELASPASRAMAERIRTELLRREGFGSGA